MNAFLLPGLVSLLWGAGLWSSSDGALRTPDLAAPAAADWPHARGNPQATGMVAHAGPRTRPAVLWRFPSGGPKPGNAMGSMSCVPVVRGGVVYWGADDAKLYAVCAANGKKVWEYAFKDALQTAQRGGGPAVLGSPAVEADRLFASAFGGRVVCLDPATGKLIWQSTGSRGVLLATGSPVVAGEKVVAGHSGGLVFHKVADGDDVYRPSFPPSPTSGVRAGVFGPLTTDGRHVFFGTDNGRAYCLEVESGDQKWEFDTGFDVAFLRGAVALAGEAALFAARDTLFCLDAKTGKLIWKKTPEKDANLRSPAVGEEFVIVASAKGKFYRLDRKDGRIQWTRTVENAKAGSVGAPIVGKDTIYLAAGDRLVALELATGRELWSLQLPAKVTSAPALAEGKLFVSGADGALYALGVPARQPAAPESGGVQR